MSRATSDAELDAKLDRVSRRLEARRDEVRSRLEAAPQLAACLDALKATFGIRLKWIRVGEWERGTEPERGVPCGLYRRPKRRGQ